MPFSAVADCKITAIEVQQKLILFLKCRVYAHFSPSIQCSFGER